MSLIQTSLEILKFRVSDTQPFIYIFLAGFHLDIRKQKYSYLLALERLYQFGSTNFLSKYLYYKYYQQVPLVLMLWLGITMNKQYSASPVRLNVNSHFLYAVLFIFQDTALSILILATMTEESLKGKKKKNQNTTNKKSMTKI